MSDVMEIVLPISLVVDLHANEIVQQISTRIVMGNVSPLVKLVMEIVEMVVSIAQGIMWNIVIPSAIIGIVIMPVLGLISNVMEIVQQRD